MVELGKFILHLNFGATPLYHRLSYGWPTTFGINSFIEPNSSTLPGPPSSQYSNHDHKETQQSPVFQASEAQPSSLKSIRSPSPNHLKN